MQKILKLLNICKKLINIIIKIIKIYFNKLELNKDKKLQNFFLTTKFNKN